MRKDLGSEVWGEGGLVMILTLPVIEIPRKGKPCGLVYFTGLLWLLGEEEDKQR